MKFVSLKGGKTRNNRILGNVKEGRKGGREVGREEGGSERAKEEGLEEERKGGKTEDWNIAASKLHH